MIIVHVEHFLDEAGQLYFPQWLQEAAAVLRGFDGFLDIRQLRHIETPFACHLLLRFESLSLLQNWAKSAEHDQLISRAWGK